MTRKWKAIIASVCAAAFVTICFAFGSVMMSFNMTGIHVVGG